MNGWETCAFEELFAVPLKNGVTYPKKSRGAGIKMVNMGEIFAFDRIGDQPMDRVPLTEKERSDYLLQEGDLLFARQSLKWEGAGKCSLVLPGEEPRTWEGHLIRVRLDRAKADPRFYYYLFRSPYGRSSIESIIEQVAAAGIRGSDLRKLSVPHPPLETQEAIARILASFDEKIDSNKRLIRILQTIARFEFELRFGSDEAVVSTPAGCIGDIATQKRQTVRPSDLPTDTPYIGLEHMPRGSVVLDSWDTIAKVKSSKLAFQEGDLLFGRLRPYFKKVGVALTDGVCSSDVLVISPTASHWFGFLLLLLSSDRFIQYTDAVSSGTRMPRVSWEDMARFETVLPSEAEAKEFNELARRLLKRAKSAAAQTRLLEELRDSLTNGLLVGEVEVDEERLLRG